MPNYGQIYKILLDAAKLYPKEDNKYDKTPSGIVAELGELYVLSKLQQIGLNVQRAGSQKSGYDVLIKSDGKFAKKDICIEVKSSKLNSSGIGGTNIKPNQLDYLVFVGFDKELVPRVYVFDKKALEKFPTKEQVAYRTKRGDPEYWSRHKGRDYKDLHIKSFAEFGCWLSELTPMEFEQYKTKYAGLAQRMGGDTSVLFKNYIDLIKNIKSYESQDLKKIALE